MMRCGVKNDQPRVPKRDSGGQCARPTPLHLVPDGDRAFAELREIAGCPEGLVEINRLIDEGAPLLRAYIDHPSAIGTGNTIARYEISERLLPVLAAVRARHGKVGEVKGALDHDDSPTSEMIAAGAGVLASFETEQADEFYWAERVYRAMR